MQQKINLTIAAFIVLLVGMLAYSAPACDGSEGLVSGDLYSKKWLLTAIEGKEVAIKGEAPFIVFDKEKGSAGGNTGCNLFGSTVKVEGKKLSITDVVSTMRACIEDDRMTIERQFLDTLQKTDRYEITDKILKLFVGDVEVLSFSGQPR